MCFFLSEDRQEKKLEKLFKVKFKVKKRHFKLWTFWTKKLNFDLWRRGLDYEGNVIKELQSGHSSGLHMTGLKSIIQQQRLCAGIGSIPNYNNIVIGFFTETKLSVKVFIFISVEPHLYLINVKYISLCVVRGFKDPEV